MTHPNKQIKCKNHIILACAVIRSLLQTVNVLFRLDEKHQIHYFCKEGGKILLETQLDAATITCLFGENDLCEEVRLFSDDLTDIASYRDCCNTTFSYDVKLNGWRANGCLIQIHAEDQECSLLVHPIKSRQV